MPFASGSQLGGTLLVGRTSSNFVLTKVRSQFVYATVFQMQILWSVDTMWVLRTSSVARVLRLRWPTRWHTPLSSFVALAKVRSQFVYATVFQMQILWTVNSVLTVVTASSYLQHLSDANTMDSQLCPYSSRSQFVFATSFRCKYYGQSTPSAASSCLQRFCRCKHCGLSLCS